MAEQLPPYEEWKLDNPGYSKTYYDQLKHIEEGGSPYLGPASLFSNIAKLFKRDKVKVEEDTPKYDKKLPEIKLTSKDADEIIKKVVSNDQPDLKELVKTAELKIEAQEKPKTMLCDLINAEVDEDTLELTKYNTKMFKHIVNRYEDEVYTCQPA